MRNVRYLVVFLVCLLCACSDDDGGDPADAQLDGAVDADNDTATDMVTDSTEDAPPANDWSCLGSVAFPTPSETEATVDMTAADFVTGLFIADLDFEICAKSDTDCATPITNGTTDADGAASFTVPLGEDGFDGYLQTTEESLTPTLSFLNPPATEVLDEPLAFRFLNQEGLSVFATLAGVTLDDERGHAAFLVEDCAGEFAAGVSFTIDTADANSTATYIADGLPAPDATETDAGGAAGYFNVPVGAATVTATLNDTSQVIGTYELFFRAGWISQAPMVPSP